MQGLYQSQTAAIDNCWLRLKTRQTINHATALILATIFDAANPANNAAIQHHHLSEIETFYLPDNTYDFDRLYRYFAVHVPYRSHPPGFSIQRVKDWETYFNQQVNVTRTDAAFIHWGISDEVALALRALWAACTWTNVWTAIKAIPSIVSRMTVEGIKLVARMAVKGFKYGARMALKGLKQATRMTLRGLQTGAQMAVNGCEMVLDGVCKASEYVYDQVKKAPKATAKVAEVVWNFVEDTAAECADHVQSVTEKIVQTSITVARTVTSTVTRLASKVSGWFRLF